MTIDSVDWWGHRNDKHRQCLRSSSIKGKASREVVRVDVGPREGFYFGVRMIREIWSYFQDYGKALVEKMRLEYKRDEESWWKEAPKESGRLRSKAQVRKRRTRYAEKEIIRKGECGIKLTEGWSDVSGIFPIRE